MNQIANVKEPKKINGAKFVVWFLVASFVISVVFCFAIYKSYMTRPKVQIQMDKE